MLLDTHRGTIRRMMQWTLTGTNLLGQNGDRVRAYPGFSLDSLLAALGREGNSERRSWRMADWVWRKMGTELDGTLMAKHFRETLGRARSVSSWSD